MLAGAVTVLPLAGLFMMDSMLAVRFGSHDILPNINDARTLADEMRATGIPVDQPSLGHLRFLYYLCFFYVLIPVCQFLVRHSHPVAPTIRRLMSSPAFLLLFALVTVATSWPFRGGQVHEGFIFIKPHLPSLIYYGSFFVFGYLFHCRSQGLNHRLLPVSFSGENMLHEGRCGMECRYGKDTGVGISGREGTSVPR